MRILFNFEMSYRFLEHTADVKFEAEGESLEEAFSEAVYALKETIDGKIAVLEQIEKKIEVSGKDFESLLYNFLEEFLVLLDSQNFLISKIKSIEIDKNSFKLSAVVAGDNAEKYKFTNDVKAVTYNSMFVKFDEQSKKWKLQVVLDV